jgi:hypothetical protein
VAHKGFLLIADITGYTIFLTSSELEHAQGVLDALFKSIFAEIKAPIVLSNLQGDAADRAIHAARRWRHPSVAAQRASGKRQSAGARSGAADNPLVAAKKLALRQRASKAALQRLVAEDLAAAGTREPTAA